jgi:anti-sigma-K factor RskA
MPGVKDGKNYIATVFWDTKTKDVYLLNNNLPQAPQGKQYQLWAIIDGKPVDAGMMDVCSGVCRMKNIPAAQAFAITLEAQGGNPTPQGEMYVLGKI